MRSSVCSLCLQTEWTCLCFSATPLSGLLLAATTHPPLPANAASASSGFGRDSASMSMFPGSAITAIVATSASDSVSEPTGGSSMGGSSSPSAFVAESASSILQRYDKSRMRPSSGGAETRSERSRVGSEPEEHAQVPEPGTIDDESRCVYTDINVKRPRMRRAGAESGRQPERVLSTRGKRCTRRLPEKHEATHSGEQRTRTHTHAEKNTTETRKSTFTLNFMSSYIEPRCLNNLNWLAIPSLGGFYIYNLVMVYRR